MIQWAEKYHEERYRLRPDIKHVKTDMLIKMPWSLKPIFIGHMIRMFCVYRVYWNIAPSSWKIRRLEKMLAKNDKKIKANYINDRFEIMDL